MILFALSMAASLTLFFILFSTANYILDDIFQNSNFRKDISDPLVSRFQYYVTEKNLKATETFAIRDWAEENKVDYFTISRENLLLYDNAYMGKIPLDDTESEQLNYTRLYMSNVRFADGDADVFIYKNVERKYYFTAYAISALLSGCAGFVIVLFGIKKEVLYIVELGNEVNKMNSGLEKKNRTKYQIPVFLILPNSHMLNGSNRDMDNQGS